MDRRAVMAGLVALAVMPAAGAVEITRAALDRTAQAIAERMRVVREQLAEARKRWQAQIDRRDELRAGLEAREVERLRRELADLQAAFREVLEARKAYPSG